LRLTPAQRQRNDEGATTLTKLTHDQIRALLLAEFTYWQTASEKSDELAVISIGALGAVSNVLAAMEGHPAPWHPQPAPQPRGEELQL
jgi:hypothetical protein